MASVACGLVEEDIVTLSQCYNEMHEHEWMDAHSIANSFSRKTCWQIKWPLSKQIGKKAIEAKQKS